MFGVILAGGAGTRLWPQSRANWPKFLLKFSKHSLLQECFLRLSSFIPEEKILIITNVEHKFLVEEDITDLGVRLPHGNIICEPSPKNTAPAIAVASRYVSEKFADEPMLICPSDHIIGDKKKFAAIIKSALPAAKNQIIVFGISPSRPETGYGYIEFSKKLSAHIYAIEKFIEKPDFSAANRYLREKKYYWNAGIFLFKPSVILSELRRFIPKLYSAVHSWNCDPATLKKVFEKIQAESIDYGVLEKTKNIAACRLDVNWDDLGDWNSMNRVYCPDLKSGNISTGRAMDLGSENTTVIAGQRLTATVGLKNIIVVDTEDALLVCDKSRAQDVKSVVAKLSESGKKEEITYHKKVSRPWGEYIVLEKGEGYKVKMIHVLPGKKLSLQKHKKRSEHWLVVDGKAKIVKADKSFVLKKGQMIEIPSYTTHRLENISKSTLKIIEIARGKYIAEDDIIRIQDDFDRK